MKETFKNEGERGKEGGLYRERGLVESIERELSRRTEKQQGKNAGVAKTPNGCASPVWAGVVLCCSAPGSAR